jgi:hypothetical protein
VINLAGSTESDIWCAAELTAAGITIEVADKPYGEPRTRVKGRLGGITFERAWYYWIASGPVPLGVARRLYADPVGGKDVRVAGHCGCPPPDEWAKGGYVRSYHIDSPAGLRLFADAVRP